MFFAILFLYILIFSEWFKIDASVPQNMEIRIENKNSSISTKSGRVVINYTIFVALFTSMGIYNALKNDKRVTNSQGIYPFKTEGRKEKLKKA